MKLPAYPNYKASGVEWLGDVPEHWNAQEVKFCYSIQLGKMLQPEPSSLNDEETPYLKSQHVQWEHVRITDLPTMWTTKSERKKYSVTDGDLLVCEGGDVGRAATVHGASDGTIIQNALHRVRPQGDNEVGFLLYVLKHAASQGWFEIICNKSTIAHFTVDKFGALGIALPSPEEQQAIAEFLDRETGRIDRLVAKKRELIERLKEKRTALISRTVTRGLPPAAARAAGLPENPTLKPSGLDWLGDVPEHWEVKRGRFAMRVNPPAPQLRALKPEDEVSFVPMEALGVQGGIKLDQTRILAEVTTGYTEFQDGDVIVAKITPCFENGKAALVSGLLNGVAYGTTELHVLRAKESLDRSFLFYVAISDTFQKLGESEMYGAGGQKRVPPEFNKDFRTPLPPLSEQRAIAEFLDRETAKLDALVAKVEAALERLQEYRTALITAAVTGKIDVRNAVARA